MANRVLAAVRDTGNPQDAAHTAAALGGWKSVLDAAVELARQVAEK